MEKKIKKIFLNPPVRRLHNASASAGSRHIVQWFALSFAFKADYSSTFSHDDIFQKAIYNRNQMFIRIKIAIQKYKGDQKWKGIYL